MSKPKYIRSLAEERKFIHPKRWKVWCKQDGGTPRFFITASYTTPAGRVYYITRAMNIDLRYFRAKCDLVLFCLGEAVRTQERLLIDLYYTGVLNDE